MVDAKKRVLVIQTAFLGDLLLSVPLLKNIRLALPNCEIDLICRKGFSSLFKDLCLIDRGYEIQKKNKASYQAVIQQLKSVEFDLIISPHESFTSARLVSHLKAKTKIGFSRWWNRFFFNQTIQKDKSLPEALRQLSLLQNQVPWLLQKLNEFHNMQLEFESKASFNSKAETPRRLAPVPDWASPLVSFHSKIADLKLRFQLPENFVCLFPGSVWATKQWTIEGFIELGQKLQAQGKNILIMGGPGEEKLAAEIGTQLPKSWNLVNQTNLLESLSLLGAVEFVVTNDSAGQHLASLVGTPTVSVFGPTVLSFGYRPWNSNSIVVERKNLLCRPCGKHGHQLCPLGTHECMKSIRANEVYKAVQSL